MRQWLWGNPWVGKKFGRNQQEKYLNQIVTIFQLVLCTTVTMIFLLNFNPEDISSDNDLQGSDETLIPDLSQEDCYKPGVWFDPSYLINVGSPTVSYYGLNCNEYRIDILFRILQKECLVLILESFHLRVILSRVILPKSHAECLPWVWV